MISMPKKNQKINGPIIDVVSQGTKYTSGTQFFQYPPVKHQQTSIAKRLCHWTTGHSEAAAAHQTHGCGDASGDLRKFEHRERNVLDGRSGWTQFLRDSWIYWEISSYNMLCVFTMEEYNGIQWIFLYFCDNITTYIKMITWSVSMYGIKTSTLREDDMFDTLWLFNIAMENGSCLDDSPIKHGDFLVRYLK